MLARIVSVEPKTNEDGSIQTTASGPNKGATKFRVILGDGSKHTAYGGDLVTSVGKEVDVVIETKPLSNGGGTYTVIRPAKKKAFSTPPEGPGTPPPADRYIDLVSVSAGVVAALAAAGKIDLAEVSTAIKTIASDLFFSKPEDPNAPPKTGQEILVTPVKPALIEPEEAVEPEVNPDDIPF